MLYGLELSDVGLYGFVWFCKALTGLVWLCIVFVWCGMVLYGFAWSVIWFCMILHGSVWCCTVLYGFEWFCMFSYVFWFRKILNGFVCVCMNWYGVAWFSMLLYAFVSQAKWWQASIKSWSAIESRIQSYGEPQSRSKMLEAFCTWKSSYAFATDRPDDCKNMQHFNDLQLLTLIRRQKTFDLYCPGIVTERLKQKRNDLTDLQVHVLLLVFG